MSDMETVNLKTPITFRVKIHDRECAFTTKTFRGERKFALVPESKDHVPYNVTDIYIEASDPWYKLDNDFGVTVLWSNVLSVQYEQVLS